MTSNLDEQTTQAMYFEMIESELYVPLDQEVEKPPIAISIGTHQYSTPRGTFTDETPVATYGNFSFIQAPPKSFKSYFVSILASVYLRSENKWAGSDFKSYRDGRRLLHFDTEQGLWHCQKGFRRVADMAEETQGYETYALRTISYKDRIGFIEHKLFESEENDIGLVIIDGLADLVSDVNDIAQSNECVQKLMQWSAKKQCHIITVIHSNWGSDKPTGHLGSFAEKKAETQISLERNDESNVVTVKCKRSRNYGFSDFEFMINKFGFPEVIGSGYPELNF
jgi:hypothetical protein